MFLCFFPFVKKIKLQYERSSVPYALIGTDNDYSLNIRLIIASTIIMPETTRLQFTTFLTEYRRFCIKALSLSKKTQCGLAINLEAVYN